MQNGNLVIPKNSGLLNNYQTPKLTFPSNGVFDWQQNNAGATSGMGLLKKNIGTAVNQAANAGGFLSKLFSPNTSGTGALGNLSKISNSIQTPQIIPTANAQTTNSQTKSQSVGTPQTAAAQQAIDMQKFGFNKPTVSQNNVPIISQPTGNNQNSSSSTQNIPNIGVPGIWQNVVGNLANTQPSQETQNAVNSLQGQAQGQNPATTNIGTLTSIGQSESPAVQQARENLKGLLQAQSEIATNPNVAADVSVGRAAAIGGQIQAAETNLQNALQGEQNKISAATAGGNQQLTGQQQQIGAATNAGNVSNTAQSNQITGQTTAQGATQPQLGAYGQTYYNPQNRGTSGGGVSPSDPFYQTLQQYAQMYASGQQGAIPSSVTGNSVLNAQVLQMAKQINPNFNYNTATGQAAGQQAVGSSVVNMQAANIAAKGIQGTIQQFLSQNPQLNPSGFTAGNNVAQWLSGKQLGDPNYQTLANYLSEYANTLAPVLGVGGDPTNLKTQIAQSFINGAASGQSITQVLNNMSTLADQKVANFQSGGTGGGQVAGPVPNAGNITQYTGYSGW